MAIIFTAGAGDACCIMGQLHIETERDEEKKKEENREHESGAKRKFNFYYRGSHQVLLLLNNQSWDTHGCYLTH